MAATPGRLPAASSAPRAPHQLFEFKQQVTGSGPPEQVWTRGIVVGDWTVRVTHGSIANASDIDALTDKLGIPPPEMPFLHNSLTLEHAPSGFSYCFDAARALQCVDGVRAEQQLTPIQCSGTPTADPPARPKRSFSRSGIQGDLSAQLTSTKQYDWTYSSTFPGMPGATAPDVHHGDLPVKTAWVDAFHPGTDPMRDRIPVERLGAHGEPILFYDEVVLYEDELGDNGSSLLSVKVRVMPSSLLVLQRFFLRVDHVVFRLFDTRLFVSFDTSDCRTATYSSAFRRTAPTIYRS
ncbi:Tap42 interacting protein [Malassezia nana]|uniref:Tap42 interacting protein n=1 Tax=Malassezia nana TaxID=180528 RepID=A0AAF0J302_9BASI|nr:Tap42 interacting protein [Malassezia nana]